MNIKSVFALCATLVVASQMVGCIVVPGAEDIEITDDECLNVCNEQVDSCDADQLDCELLCQEIRDRDCEDLYLEAMDCQAETADRCVSDPSCEAERDAFGSCYIGE